MIQDVTLIDGRILPVQDIELASDGWNFVRKSSGEILTYQLKQRDKVAYFPRYDVAYGNEKLYQAGLNRTGSTNVGEPLSTNTTGIFARQLVTDPLAAPAEFASDAVEGAKKLVQSPQFLIVGGIVVFALAAFLVMRYAPKS
jgi:hypothetical protein